MTAMRVRQVVVAVGDVQASRDVVEHVLGLPFVYQDPGVGLFGAVNSLHGAGDTFVELLAEQDEGSPVGRHLARLQGDGGYMVIVQVDDLDHHLALAEQAGIRTIWQGSVEGVRAAHLHPADIGGAIVSVDEADPPEAWPWCGPAWSGQAGAVHGQPIATISLTSSDPVATAQRWAAVLGVTAEGANVVLPGTTIGFEPADGGQDRLVEVGIPGLPATDALGIRWRG
jgi:catechol 2,3-dioxygenase-like lactoylglutathione lyase family enzyme